MDDQNTFPFQFDSKSCKTCGGKCCRGFCGYVWLELDEIERLAEARKMDVASFAKQFVRRVDGRFSLKEYCINGEHFCCFFDRIECQCLFYNSRPRQCRTFPFWEKFKKDPQELFLECPGVSLP